MRWAAALLVAAAASCARTAPLPADANARLVVVAAGAPRPATSAAVVSAEIAADPPSRARGLGGRDRLAPDSGMLFVYPEDAARTFWMKDCYVALDIAFVDSKQKIARIITLPAGAGREDAEVARGESFVAVRYVLETESGWFARHGIGVGDAVDLSAALAGVTAR